MSRTQQHIHGAGTAVDGTCGDEGHDVHVPAQPEIYRGLEHGAACARSVTFAMDDSHAAAVAAAAREEIGEPVARRHLSEPVQIQFAVDRVEAAAQAPHHLIAYAAAMKG